MTHLHIEKLCNAFVPSATPSDALPLVALGAVSRFRKKHGGLWVGGKLVATDDGISFTPNRMNELLHETLETVNIPMKNVAAVRREFGWVTGIVVVEHSGGEFRFRCFGADKVAASLAAHAGAL